MLAVDACVSPHGELVIAAHSGIPDWGSGPDGQGKLYKILYNGKEVAQPVIAWAASPTEMRVAFDRPLDPTQLKELAKRTTITQGRYVSAGDRFESLRPGYQAVQDQLAGERYDVPVLSAMLTADHRQVRRDGKERVGHRVLDEVGVDAGGRRGGVATRARQSEEL